MLQWARRWMDADVVRLVVEPAVADAQHEIHHAPTGERPRLVREARAHLALALVGALTMSASGRVRRSPWWVLGLPLVVLSIGSALYLRQDPTHLAALHIGTGIIGLIVALTITAWPLANAPERSVYVGAAVLVGGLACVPLIGSASHGVTRWLTIGPLNIDVAMLVTPLFLWTIARACRHRTMIVSACMVLLLLQPHVAMCIVWAALAMSLCRDRATIVVCSLAVLVGVLTDPMGFVMPPVVGMVTRFGAVALAVAVGCYLVVAWLLVHAGRTLPTGPRRLVYAAVIACVAWPLAAPALGYAITMLGFGCSATLAMFASLGLGLRALSACSQN